MQLLFQADFNPPTSSMDGFSEFWQDKSPSPRTRAFTELLVRGVLDHQTEIDQRLEGYAEHWDLRRMSAVDRNLMRMAMYEMLYCEDIPPVVSINEAVEIAKQFSGEDSGRFVNGILDRARKDIDRPARTPAPMSGPYSAPPGDADSAGAPAGD